MADKTTFTWGIPAAPAPSPGYQRPADWLVLDEPTEGISALVAVYDGGSNLVALKCSSVGGYTVDWGDGGSPVAIANNVLASHRYDYDDVSHLTTRGYRQALVTVTPNTAGNLHVINFDVKHPATENYTSQWLDIAVAGTAVTSLQFNPNYQTQHGLLESFRYVGVCPLTSLDAGGSGIMQGMAFLQKVTFDNTAACLNYQSAFSYTTALQEAIFGDMSGATSIVTMFYASGVERVSFPTMPNLVDASSVCYGSTRLTSVTFADTIFPATLTSLNHAFADCPVLTSLVLPGIPSDCDCSNIANNDFALQSFYTAGLLDNVNVSGVFQNCAALQTASLVQQGTAPSNVEGAFSGAVSLQSVVFPAIDGIDYSGCNLGPAALDAIFTALPDVSGVGATITITGNWGVSGCDESIATALGWTVVDA